MKTHYAHVERATESDNMEYWSDTACGLEYTTNSPLTDSFKNVTCKNCLKRLTMKQDRDKETALEEF